MNINRKGDNSLRVACTLERNLSVAVCVVLTAVMCFAVSISAYRDSISCGPDLGRSARGAGCLLSRKWSLRLQPDIEEHIDFKDLFDAKTSVSLYGSPLLIKDLTLDDDGEPSFPNLPTELMPAPLVKHVTRIFSIILTYSGGEFEFLGGYSERSWVTVSNFRLSMIMYRDLLAALPLTVALPQLQNISASMSKEFIVKIPKFKNFARLKNAAEQSNDVTAPALFSKLVAEVDKLLASVSQGATDDHRLTALQLAALLEEDGVLAATMRHDQMVCCWCMLLSFMCFSALINAQAEIWTFLRDEKTITVTADIIPLIGSSKSDIKKLAKQRDMEAFINRPKKRKIWQIGIRVKGAPESESFKVSQLQNKRQAQKMCDAVNEFLSADLPGSESKKGK